MQRRRGKEVLVSVEELERILRVASRDQEAMPEERPDEGQQSHRDSSSVSAGRLVHQDAKDEKGKGDT